MIKPSELTAEMIREERGRLHSELQHLDGAAWMATKDLIHHCYVALGERGSPSKGYKAKSVLRICDELNARAGAKSGGGR